MKKRNLPKSEKTQRPRREREPIPWRYGLLMLTCGLIIVGGFFYAGKTHFSAVDYGMKNAKLRDQKEELEAEQRRFKLAREIALSPAEIKKAARKLGFQDMSASNIQILDRPENVSNNLVEKTSYVRPKNDNPVKPKEEKSQERTEKKADAAKTPAKLNKTGK